MSFREFAVQHDGEHDDLLQELSAILQAQIACDLQDIQEIFGMYLYAARLDARYGMKLQGTFEQKVRQALEKSVRRSVAEILADTALWFSRDDENE
jgi:hypothetical protein